MCTCTHTSIVLPKCASHGHQPWQTVSPDYRGGHAALTFSVQPQIPEKNLILLLFLAVIVLSIRILCDLFNFSKCVHVGRGIIFLKEPTG